MPASYGIHPVIHAEHLATYIPNTTPIVDRPTKSLSRDDFDTLHEFEIERIVSEKKLTRGKRKYTHYLVRWKGYDSSADTWEPERNLKNAPEVLRAWKRAISANNTLIASKPDYLYSKITKLPLSENNGLSCDRTSPPSTPTTITNSQLVSYPNKDFPMDQITNQSTPINNIGPRELRKADNTINKKVRDLPETGMSPLEYKGNSELITEGNPIRRKSIRKRTV
jgi:hypothetical protein